MGNGGQVTMRDDTVARHSRTTVLWRPVVAAFVLAALIFGADVYGSLTSGGRMTPEVKAALANRGYIGVAVVLSFPPEGFHMKYFQNVGTMGGVVGTTVMMRRISADQVWALAGDYWIQRIELLPAP